MDLRSVTIFQFQQCPQPLQQHTRLMASFPLVLTRNNLQLFRETGTYQRRLSETETQEESKRNDGEFTKKEYSKRPTCEQRNHTADRCWKGAGAAPPGTTTSV